MLFSLSRRENIYIPLCMPRGGEARCRDPLLFLYIFSPPAIDISFRPGPGEALLLLTYTSNRSTPAEGIPQLAQTAKQVNFARPRGKKTNCVLCAEPGTPHVQESTTDARPSVLRGRSHSLTSPLRKASRAEEEPAASFCCCTCACAEASSASKSNEWPCREMCDGRAQASKRRAIRSAAIFLTVPVGAVRAGEDAVRAYVHACMYAGLAGKMSDDGVSLSR